MKHQIAVRAALLLGAVSVAGSGGFMAGRWSDREKPGTAALYSISTDDASRRPARPTARESDVSPADTRRGPSEPRADDSGQALWLATATSDEVTRWLSTVPDEQRAGAALEAVYHLAGRDPAAAFEVATGLHDDALQEETTRFAAATWARLDGPAAARWCVVQRDRATCLDSVIGAWAAGDPLAASAWLAERLAQEHPGDAPILTLIEPLLTTEPDSAWAWAGRLADPTARRATQQRIATAWSASSATLPPDVAAAAADTDADPPAAWPAE